MEVWKCGSGGREGTSVAQGQCVCWAQTRRSLCGGERCEGGKRGLLDSDWVVFFCFLCSLQLCRVGSGAISRMWELGEVEANWREAYPLSHTAAKSRRWTREEAIRGDIYIDDLCIASKNAIEGYTGLFLRISSTVITPRETWTISSDDFRIATARPMADPFPLTPPGLAYGPLCSRTIGPKPLPSRWAL